MELSELFDYLKIEDDEEEEKAGVLMLQQAAEAYLLNAGIEKDYTNPLYKLAVVKYVSHEFEHKETPLNLNSLILSMQIRKANEA